MFVPNSRSLSTLVALSLFALLLMVVAFTPLNQARSGGISSSDSSNGCKCHSGNSPDSQVIPTLEGLPQRYQADTTYQLYINFTGGPAAGGSNHGGFNIKVNGGTLAVRSGDTTVQTRSDGSLTHTSAGNDQRFWEVDWTAPDNTDSNVTFTLQVNSVNGDGSANSADRWNRLVVKVSGSITDAAVSELNAPSSSDVDTPVDLTVMVENVGNEQLAAHELVTTVLLDDDEVWNGTYQIETLAAGAIDTIEAQWPGGGEGTYTIQAAVNYDGDTNTDNDMLETDIEVVLNLTDVAVTLEGVPLKLLEQTPVTFTSQVENLGTIDLNDVVVGVTLVGTSNQYRLDNQTIASLTAGGDTDLDWDWAGGAPDSYMVSVISYLEDDVAVNDRDQANLEVTVNLTDVGVSLAGVPADTTDNNSITFTVTVVNEGTIELSGATLTAEALEGATQDWTADEDLPDLAPGANLSRDLTWPGGTAGTYTLKVTVSHPWDSVSGNDMVQATVTVTAPDLPDGTVWTVGVTGLDFVPADLEIEVGDTVNWVWTDSSAPHNVAESENAGSNTYLAGGFRSGDVVSTLDYSVTFDTAGTFYYLCEPHATSGMKGTIVVGDAEPDPDPDPDPTADGDDSPGLLALELLAVMALVAMAMQLRRR